MDNVGQPERDARRDLAVAVAGGEKCDEDGRSDPLSQRGDAPSARWSPPFAPRCRVAEIYVYDNDSRDGTAEAARAAGVAPRFEPTPGKGNVVRRMFADIEADVYVLVDGDATYRPPSAAANGRQTAPASVSTWWSAKETPRRRSDA